MHKHKKSSNALKLRREPLNYESFFNQMQMTDRLIFSKESNMKEKNIDIKEALNERDGFQVWWRLLRPHTLTASFIPVLIGTFVAHTQMQVFHFGLFFAMLIASILIQAATNMFNEYYDYKRGLDNEHSVGLGGTIVRDGIEPKTVLRLRSEERRVGQADR